MALDKSLEGPCMCPMEVLRLLWSAPSMPAGMASRESPDCSRAAAEEGLRGRVIENLDIVDALLPRVSCLPTIPAIMITALIFPFLEQ